MGVLATLLEACGLLGFTWWLLARYRDPHVSAVGVVGVFVSWTLGFLGLLLLPIDIARHGALFSAPTDADGEDDEGEDVERDRRDFVYVWQALYWLTFVLSWLLLPLLVEFTQNGEFELKRRLVSSMKRMIFHWTIVATISTAIIVYLLLVGHFTVQGLLGLAMATANTYGVVWLIILLGYGLVDIPRSLWLLRDPDARLRALYFRATQVHNERMESIFLYQDVLGDVRRCYDRMLHAEAASIVLTSDMQDVKAGLTAVMALVEAEDADTEHGRMFKKTSIMASRSTKSPMLSTSTVSMAPPTYGEVVELHRRVKAAQADLRGSEQAWQEVCITAEALQTQTRSNSALPPVGIYSTVGILSQAQSFASVTQSHVQRVVLPVLWGFGSVVTAIESVCVLWGEFTMAWTPRLSLFRVLSFVGIDSAATVEVVAFALLVHMVVCAYSTLFKLRSFGRFALRGQCNSSELALLKTSIYQCRLQFALSYNFLLLIHEPRLTDTTAFHRLWSHMQVVRVFGQDFSLYAPVLMVVLVGCTKANVYARVMKQSIGMEQYEQLVPGHPEHEAQIDKGESLVRKGLERLRRDHTHPPKRTQWRGRGFDDTNPDMAASLLEQDYAGHDLEQHTIVS